MSPKREALCKLFSVASEVCFLSDVTLERWQPDCTASDSRNHLGAGSSAERRLYLANQRPPLRPAVQCGRVRLSRQLDCESSGRGSRTFVEMFELFGTNDLRIVKFDTGRMRLCEEGKAKKFLETTKPLCLILQLSCILFLKKWAQLDYFCKLLLMCVFY